MESANIFDLVFQKFNQTVIYFEDERRRNYQNSSRSIQLFERIWISKVVQIVTFTEKGKILVLVIQHLHQIYKVLQAIK